MEEGLTCTYACFCKSVSTVSVTVSKGITRTYTYYRKCKNGGVVSVNMYSTHIAVSVYASTHTERIEKGLSRTYTY